MQRRISPVGGLSPVSFDQTRSIPNSDVVQQKRRINAYLTDHKQQLRFKTIQLSNTNTSKVGQDVKNEEAQSDIVENIPQ